MKLKINKNSAKIIKQIQQNEFILKITQKSTKLHLLKLKELLKEISIEIGLNEELNDLFVAYLYLKSDVILGLLICEPIKHGKRGKISDDLHLNGVITNLVKVDCKIGIHLIWTSVDKRSKGILIMNIN